MMPTGEIVAPQTAVIINIQGFSIHDGPGIRTVVFFKGCPLSCRWCANPECLSVEPQVGFIETLCTDCGKCFEICAHKAIRPGEGVHRIDYSRCNSCGDCVDHCGYGALVRYGESKTVADVWDVVRRDKIFYDSSGGGVTASGGEPLLRAGFVRELFELCKGEQINTCIETCGLAGREALLEVIPVTDHFLFDLKHMDSDLHNRHTGQPNSLILENAAWILEQSVDTVFRQPLVPGINDTTGNIEATAAFLSGLGKSDLRLELMPYHRMGQSKYRALNMKYPMDGTDAAEEEMVESVMRAYQDRGIRCTISR
ncbi:MAG: glycyl-radical enzyme activating protein [Acidobacteria bacterium]|nr:glycyl-radical enzyme activating protein [Acidobacteriota bacterium]